MTLEQVPNLDVPTESVGTRRTEVPDGRQIYVSPLQSERERSKLCNDQAILIYWQV
jgi:hypothetical protein